MSVVNGDLLDEGLQNVMGKDRCQNEWKPAKKPMADPVNTKYGDEVKMEKPVTASWEPVKPDPNWLDNLKACAKHVVLFGGLSILFFYWQQTGQMESSAAVPSMCACTALAGLGVGRNIR